MVSSKTVTNNNKKSRCRSPEKKAQQREHILEVGKQLFQKQGRDGFSLRALAKNLDMNQNNLYNYVESKRELWIAIRKKFYEQYRDENREIMKNFTGSTVDLLLNIFKHFFEFADNDYAAFRMMHIIPSPPSEKIGPYEKEYKQFGFLDGTTRVIQKAIDGGEIKEENAALLSFYIYSLLLGATMVEKTMHDLEMSVDKKGKEAEELLQFGNQKFSSTQFREYVLGKIESGLKHQVFL